MNWPFNHPHEYGGYLAWIRYTYGDGAYAREIRRLVKSDLLFLCYCLGFEDVDNDFHRRWIREEVEFIGTKHRLSQQLVARGHFKSTVITCAWSLREVIRQRGKVRVGITAYDGGIAEGFLSQIKDICEKSHFLQAFFPEIFWDDFEGVVPWRADALRLKGKPQSQKEYTYEAFGLLSQPTSRHYDIIICDDIVDKNSVINAERINETASFHGLLFSLLEPGGIVINTGTNYHFHDQYQRTEKKKAWHCFRQPVINGDLNGECAPAFWTRFTMTEKQAHELRSLYKRHGKKAAKVVSVEELRDNQPPYDFACQNLLSPIQPGQRTFELSMIRFETWGEDRLKGTSCVLGMDPAKTTGLKSAFSSMWVVRKDHTGRMLVEEMVNARMDTVELMDTLFSLMRAYSCTMAGIERTGWEDIERVIQERQMKEQSFFDVQFFNAGNKSKEDRAKRTLELPFKRGKIAFHEKLRHLPAFKTFQSAFVDFPYNKYWDQIDSLVWTLRCDAHAFDGGKVVELPKTVPGTAGEIFEKIKNRSFKRGKSGFYNRY